MAEEYRDIEFFYGEINQYELPDRWVEEITQQAMNMAKNQIRDFNDVDWDIDGISVKVEASVSFARYGDSDDDS